MKFRTDFVTNSSSSSFVIAMTNDDVHKPIIEALVQATDYMDTQEGLKVTTLKEAEEYIVDRWGYSNSKTIEEAIADSSYAKKIYDMTKTAIGNGKVVVYKEIGYDAEALTAFLKYLQNFDPSVEIINLD